MRHNAEQAQERDTGRLEAFSDGVFAIAITLLVLDIKVPHAGPGRRLWPLLLVQWPSYFSYVISFLIIGVVWANHHALFRDIRRVDRTLIWLNMLLLMNVAFIPFAAALLAEYIGTPEARTAAMVYAGTLTAGGVPFNLLWGYAAHHHRLLAPDADPRRVRRMTRLWVLGPLLYLASFVLAYFWPKAALVMFALLALLYAFSPDRAGAGIARVRPELSGE